MNPRDVAKVILDNICYDNLNVADIVIVKKGKVRQAKLGFLRKIVGQYKIKERGLE